MNYSHLWRSALTGALLLGTTNTYAQAATFPVSNLNDSGTGSLRQALANANATSGTDTITFASSVKGTLTLKTGELTISSDVSIVGPGVGVLTVSGNGSARLFTITGGTVALSGLTFAKGVVKGKDGVIGRAKQSGVAGEDASGGAIFNQGSLTLTRCSFSDNMAQGGNGGSGGIGSISSGLHAGTSGGAARGGAIFTTGALTLIGTRFEGNIAQGGAGGAGDYDAWDSWGALGGKGGDAYGGAVYSVRNPIVQGSTFLDNQAIGGIGGKGQNGSNRPRSNAASGIAAGNDIFNAFPQAKDTTLSGMARVAFAGQLVASGEGITYSVVSGSLPGGLKLDTATGAITGTPTQSVADQHLTFKVSNSFGTSTAAVATFNIAPESVVNVNAPTVREGNGGTAKPSQLVFTLTRSKDVSRSASLTVQTTPASTVPATAKSDYVPLNPTRITFAAGQTQQWVAVTIVGDVVYEDNEQVALQLTGPTDVILSQASAEGTILNDDPLPTLSINDVSVVEGNSNYSKATFTVTRLGASDRTISVGYSTYSSGRNAAIGGTTTTADVDYLSASGTLTFAPAQLSQTITVYIKGDTVVEGTEPFLVRLSTPANARIADGTGVGTIQNDDSAPASNSLDGGAPPGSGGNS